MKISILSIIISLNFIFAEEYFLYSPIIPYPEGNTNFYTFLINRDGEIKRIWDHDSSPASIPYLYDDNILIRPALVEFPAIDLPGRGGLIQKVDWLGNILWEYEFSDEFIQQHHDIEVLPNGNILVLAWEKKTQEEVIQKGKLNHTGVLYVDMIIEIEPGENNSGNIVWEWHFWDHLIQDVNPNYDNYGIVSEHPELLNINFLNSGGGDGPGPPGNESPDFTHCNAIHYNELLDQIIITSRRANEIFIIDHSTTTNEASSNNGGIYGKGGDFLYRWGNPQNYDIGSSNQQILFAPHSANWIKEDLNGGGNILIYNNGLGMLSNVHSSIIEIVPPLDLNNGYIYEQGTTFLPDTTVMNFNNNFSFFSTFQSGVFKLENDNILVTVTEQDYIFELNQDLEIVWEYFYEGDGHIARMINYDLNLLHGDLNFDNIINVSDILIVIENILFSQNSYVNIINNDINNDNYVDIYDLILLVRMLL